MPSFSFSNRKQVHMLLGTFYMWSAFASFFTLIQEPSAGSIVYLHNDSPSFLVKCVAVLQLVTEGCLLAALFYGGCTWEYSSHEYVDTFAGFSFSFITLIINRFGFSLVIMVVRGLCKASISKLHLVTFEIQPQDRTPAMIMKHYGYLALLEMVEASIYLLVMGILLAPPLTLTACIQVIALAFLSVTNFHRVITAGP